MLSRVASVQLAIVVALGLPAIGEGISPNPPGGSTTTPASAIELSAADGSMLAIRQAGLPGQVVTAESIIHSGKAGLWQIKFADGSILNASDFSAEPPISKDRSFHRQVDPQSGCRTMIYKAEALQVTITATTRPDGVDLVGRVQTGPASKTVLDFSLPARLRFDARQVERVVCPMNGNESVGAAFKAGFFARQSSEHPTAWDRQPAGPRNYASLFGGDLVMRQDGDAAARLRATADGQKWLGPSLAKRIEASYAVVNRPPGKGQADLVLVDSDNGDWFSASRLGGDLKGLLWRIGGSVGQAEQGLATAVVLSAIDKLSAEPGAGRTKLGLIRLTGGPESGGWAGVPTQEWATRFKSIAPVKAGKVQVVELTTPTEVTKAVNAGDFLAVLNPYGEWIPVGETGGSKDLVAAVGKYVRDGGNWFEVGGYPFYYELVPASYLHYEATYPDAFADFLQLDSKAGTVAVYGVQPQTHRPWQGAKDKQAIFIPGRLGCGGDADGGYLERAFGTYVAAGETWQSPVVRLTVGHSAQENLRAYCQANAFARRLADKVPPKLLDTFKDSVLVKYNGTCKEKADNLKWLPVPSLIHFPDYLKGGFDKEYPDHLPPNAKFATAEEFRAFIDASHKLGHLIVPYTNPTWWCDHPRGPTFQREGEAPLLKLLDGKLSYERYGPNDGYTVCHWHPAVQQANRRTLRQFTEDFPADVLFQDQVGARGWHYDTNPASPAVYAYADGLISMAAEDSEKTVLSTESGWDRVVNYESQLCGLSWSIVPTEHPPQWRRLMKHSYPPATWEIFPLAQYIAHDKSAMLGHDLGQFVTNRRVLAWMLGLGFGMSYVTSADGLKDDGRREWLSWLSRVQKSVCSRYTGQPLDAFQHDRSGCKADDEDGALRARYGDLRIVANLDSKPLVGDGRNLAPFGFLARGPGLVAGSVKSLGGVEFNDDGMCFVAEGDPHRVDLWFYAASGQRGCAELPPGIAGEVILTFDAQPAMSTTVRDGVISFMFPTTPAAQTRPDKPQPQAASPTLRLWHAVGTAGK